ncbi:hypothetical protein ACP70R_028975 [Stipagrostis hirtigluma subsp. patula]
MLWFNLISSAAMIYTGHDESPPAERLRDKDMIDPLGTNFTTNGMVVLNGTDEVPKRSYQITKFRWLLNYGIITKYLKESVALNAFSGNHDCAHVHHETSQAITSTHTCTYIYADNNFAMQIDALPVR